MCIIHISKLYPILFMPAAVLSRIRTLSTCIYW